MYFNLQMFAEDIQAEGSQPATGTAAEITPEGEGGQVAAGEEEPETFESLIEGKYKEEYGKKVNEAISRRFRNQMDYEARFHQLAPAIAMLANKYGLDASNIGQMDLAPLVEKITSDNEYYEKEAFERGMKVEDFKAMKRIEMENQRLKQEQQRYQREEQNRSEYAKLVQQSEEVKKVYPEFNLETEMQNPDFGRLVAVNVPIQTAYEVVHKDDILKSGMQYAVQQTKQKVVNAVKAGQNRPGENGISSQSAADISVKDFSKLTAKDFQELRRRAERGERITF